MESLRLPPTICLTWPLCKSMHGRNTLLGIVWVGGIEERRGVVGEVHACFRIGRTLA